MKQKQEEGDKKGGEGGLDSYKSRISSLENGNKVASLRAQTFRIMNKTRRNNSTLSGLEINRDNTSIDTFILESGPEMTPDAIHKFGCARVVMTDELAAGPYGGVCVAELDVRMCENGEVCDGGKAGEIVGGAKGCFCGGGRGEGDFVVGGG